MCRALGYFFRRLMYDHEKYTRLTPHTYTAWAEVERESGIQLVHKCGGVYWARKGQGRENALMVEKNRSISPFVKISSLETKVLK